MTIANSMLFCSQLFLSNIFCVVLYFCDWCIMSVAMTMSILYSGQS